MAANKTCGDYIGNADSGLNGTSTTWNDHIFKSTSLETMSTTQSSYKSSDNNVPSFGINDGLYLQSVDGTASSLVEVDTDNNSTLNDGDSHVAQITVSLASLVQLPSEPSIEVEMIECTLQDLVNGDTSETIQNILRNLKDKHHPQKDNINSEEHTKDHKTETTSVSHEQSSDTSRDEDYLRKRMIEKAKKINGAKLNAFAVSFIPSSSQKSLQVHDDLSATENLSTLHGHDLIGKGDQSMPSTKLNPIAPSFVPQSIGTE
ncbi:hypothetical protein K492DRAFT_207598 [Lichtheimia hyalospora FSU 10163]|nr:hypothetical protein K492DRAFT_207598 [Lichtheimia hyalospora FSU 10163]